MAEPTLNQVFGANAIQDANTLRISKTDLATVGLTASATNTPESLLVALILLWQQHLTPTNQSSNPEQSITIEDGFPTIVYRESQPYRQASKTINIQKIDTSVIIDPDDY